MMDKQDFQSHASWRQVGAAVYKMPVYTYTIQDFVHSTMNMCPWHHTDCYDFDGYGCYSGYLLSVNGRKWKGLRQDCSHIFDDVKYRIENREFGSKNTEYK